MLPGLFSVFILRHLADALLPTLCEVGANLASPVIRPWLPAHIIGSARSQLEFARRPGFGRTWIRTTDLFLIRDASLRGAKTRRVSRPAAHLVWGKARRMTAGHEPHSFRGYPESFANAMPTRSCAYGIAPCSVIRRSPKQGSSHVHSWIMWMVLPPEVESRSQERVAAEGR